jgi:hypothetical protein
MPIRCLIVWSVLVASVALHNLPADAGCGCDKPPPPPSAVRPNVAYPGAPVTFFGQFEPGAAYTVTFTSATTGESRSASAVASLRRDLADRLAKLQIEVAMPALPPGPVSATVTADASGSAVLSVPDRDLTATAAPLPVPNALGAWELPGARGAVGRDGVVYVALDLTSMQEPMVVTAQALGYPLRFNENDVVFYNRQGFVMQRLVSATKTGTQPVPGMFVVSAENGFADSDELHYSRHEFVTYFLQHAERQPHAVDPQDGNWHFDGSPHIDHDHLILAIAGRLNDGTTPPPGATPVFDLKLTTYSLFHSGVMGRQSVEIGGSAIVDSYDSDTMLRGASAAVSSLNAAKVKDVGLVMGDLTAPMVTFEKLGAVTGTTAAPSVIGTLMAVKIPTGIPNLGDYVIKSGTSQTLSGPGSFQAHKFKLETGARLFVDNAAGPVTIYVTDEVNVADKAVITVADRRPERFAIYSASDKPIQFNGTSRASGSVYAPDAQITVAGDADFSGALVGKTLVAKDRVRVHYDSTLRGDDALTDCLQMTQLAPVAGKAFDAKVQCVNGEKTSVGFLVTGVTSPTATCTLVASDPKTVKPLSSLGFTVKVQCSVVGAPFQLAIQGIS